MHRIMIVDDEAVITTQLEECVTGMGYETAGVAFSGKESVKMAERLKPDLILMDIVMPGKIDGIAAAKIIKEKQDIPVIFLTGYAENHFIDRAKHVEPFGYIVKPFQEREIRASIEVALYKKEAERRLRESEKKYRLLVNNIPGVTFTGYKDWSIDFTDNKIEILTGHTMEDFSSRRLKWVDIVVKDDMEKIKKIFTKALKSNKTYICEYRIKSKKGKIIWIQQRGQIICDDQGEILHISGVLFDISERKRAEEEKERLGARLQQVERMEAVGTLAGGVAHGFNNVLMSIQGNTSLMLVDTGASHPHRERLKNIEQSVRIAADLTGQLLGFARGGKYQLELTDLNEMVKKTSGMFGGTKKEIKIHRRYQEDIWTVTVDQGQIEQVLSNLYVNAWQAMPGGGDLHLQTENITLDQDYVKPFSVEPGRYVKISITDTGAGMDEETRRRIFEPFFTTKEMGRETGLALASVYGIVKNHGGIINVYSEKGEGTTFNIYLPTSEKEIIIEEEPPEELLKGEETVLLVDDEDMIIDVGQGMFKALGYKVLTARSGKEAIEIYKANSDNTDMVILDMIMPGMGGGETYDRMRKINPGIKVLLSSGYSINGQAQEILERGCDGFIQKPFNMSQLSQRIREVLDS